MRLKSQESLRHCGALKQLFASIASSSDTLPMAQRAYDIFVHLQSDRLSALLYTDFHLGVCVWIGLLDWKKKYVECGLLWSSSVVVCENLDAAMAVESNNKNMFCLKIFPELDAITLKSHKYISWIQRKCLRVGKCCDSA